MSVISPRDFSAVARSKGGSEAGVLPPSLLVPSKVYAAISGDAADAGQGFPQRRVRWGRRSSAVGHPVGGPAKRVFDIAVASVALVLLSPLLLVIASAIKLLTGGDVIYRHRRVGMNGRLFNCLKFRTMVPNGDEVLRWHIQNDPAAAEEWRMTRKLANDPRVTPLGYLLRKTSLDELPQLFNILRGDMSCVGPRPIVADELHFYGENASYYMKARPGITGLWQVSGRSLLSYQERVQYDVRYVREWSLRADMAILVRTIPAVLKTDQAA
ncbi:sugar transferase [Hyphomicrobium sp.]|uniref:sugar transferase n=1 Tax=Hyphomicrobium sp. TaxID=82 RepID=UPI000FA3EC37|nr:sugar transferase [Hyphomicrobium sp.]RUO97871.1 MAG: UDP-phosphate galactose phosphotransferase [Hyphomicrobium sp.]